MERMCRFAQARMVDFCPRAVSLQICKSTPLRTLAFPGWRTEDPRTLGLLFHRCCEEAEDCTLVKALCQILGITLENLKKLGEAQNQAERILLDAFRDGIRSLGAISIIFSMNKGC